MAWVVVESQRLNFQRQNQKALRADTYKIVKEATEGGAENLLQGRVACSKMTTSNLVWEEKSCQAHLSEVPAGSMHSFKMEWPSAESTTSLTSSSP